MKSLICHAQVCKFSLAAREEALKTFKLGLIWFSFWSLHSHFRNATLAALLVPEVRDSSWNTPDERWWEHEGEILDKRMYAADVLSRGRLCDPMDCGPPGSSVHGIFKARILEWVAISFFKRMYETIIILWKQFFLWSYNFWFCFYNLKKQPSNINLVSPIDTLNGKRTYWSDNLSNPVGIEVYFWYLSFASWALLVKPIL